MRRAEKAERIGQMLDEMYPEQPIPLDHTDPYTLLVAVALFVYDRVLGASLLAVFGVLAWLPSAAALVLLFEFPGIAACLLRSKSDEKQQLCKILVNPDEYATE